MKLRYYSNPVLRQKCKPVKPGDKKALQTLEEMSKKLYEWEGVGLAAPQVGNLKRMAVIDVRSDPKVVYKMINPYIIWKSKEMVESQEGCLSIPGVSGILMRHKIVSVEYLDENFKSQVIEQAEGLLARCLQHELDHLDGKMYIDRMEPAERAILLAEYKNLLADKNENERISKHVIDLKND